MKKVISFPFVFLAECLVIGMLFLFCWWYKFFPYIKEEVDTHDTRWD